MSVFSDDHDNKPNENFSVGYRSSFYLILSYEVAVFQWITSCNKTV